MNFALPSYACSGNPHEDFNAFAWWSPNSAFSGCASASEEPRTRTVSSNNGLRTAAICLSSLSLACRLAVLDWSHRPHLAP